MSDHDEATDQRIERIEAECANRRQQGCHPMREQTQARVAELKVLDEQVKGQYALLRQEFSGGVALIRQDITTHVTEIRGAVKSLQDTAVTRAEFAPIQKIVYGVVGLILAGVFTGILALVLK